MVLDSVVTLNDYHKLLKDSWVVHELGIIFGIFPDKLYADEYVTLLTRQGYRGFDLVTIDDYMLEFSRGSNE